MDSRFPRLLTKSTRRYASLFRFVRLGVPWQAHFWIGVRIYDFADMRNALLALEAAPGAKLVTGPLGPNSLVATATESQLEDSCFEIPLSYKGMPVWGTAYAVVDQKHGVEFPVPRTSDYTAALVGIQLTSRYEPSILDARHPHGRPEPFEVDLDALQDLLAQVRTWWSEAQVLLLEEWH